MLIELSECFPCRKLNSLWSSVNWRVSVYVLNYCMVIKSNNLFYLIKMVWNAKFVFSFANMKG